jgi:hypothetical protein
MMIIPVNSFNQVRIIPNSLLVFDIDETILSFEEIDEGWWKRTFSKFFNTTKDFDLAEELSLKKWISYVGSKKLHFFDEPNFKSLVKSAKKSGCEIIMLTSRKNFLFEMTINHIANYNIDIDSGSIYFNENKGQVLYDIITKKYPNLYNIIFVNDQKSNLEDIVNKFSCLEQYSLQLYNIHYFTPCCKI